MLKQTINKKELYLPNNASREKIQYALDKYGVCVLQDCIEDPQKHFKDSIDWLSEKIDALTDDPITWIPENIPYGPRYGMMQTIIGHSPTAWKMRKLAYPYFAKLHDTNELYTSIDGASIYPPPKDKFRKQKDWPHIDQTKSTCYCIQGQVVLTTTSAAFRCTPFSHHYYEELCVEYDIKPTPSNWFKFKDEDISIVSQNFDHWQIPIPVKAGSIILWNSKTIHSSMYHTKNDDWRCTYYVCFRPQKEYTSRNVHTLKRALKEGRMTNHWGTKLMGKRQGSFRGHWTKNPQLERLSEDCHLLSNDENEDWLP